MYALEISFQDGLSETETVFVRRPHALIGASEYAHVVVDDMKNLSYQLRISRELGRCFRINAVPNEGAPAPHTFDGFYDGEANIELGSVKLHVTALDTDLLTKENEPPDTAGVRLMRQAFAAHSPRFPAVVVQGGHPLVVSFSPEQPVYLGRSKLCQIRFDASDVSARHARMGYENEEFWIEDLGSTNGTFVKEQQISGRVPLLAGTPVVLGREITIVGVASEEELKNVTQNTVPPDHRKAPAEVSRYPVLISVSDVARPARLIIAHGSVIQVGRDPSSDMWLGAPHVSRKHFVVALAADNSVEVTDTSTNGTGYNGGVLHKGEVLRVRGAPQVFDVGSGVTVAVCFDEEEERQFLASQGSARSFAANVFRSDTVGIDSVNNAQVEGSIRLDTASYVAPSSRGFMHWLISNLQSGGLVGKIKLVLLLFSIVVIFAVVFKLVFGLLE